MCIFVRSHVYVPVCPICLHNREIFEYVILHLQETKTKTKNPNEYLFHKNLNILFRFYFQFRMYIILITPKIDCVTTCFWNDWKKGVFFIIFNVSSKVLQLILIFNQLYDISWFPFLPVLFIWFEQFNALWIFIKQMTMFESDIFFI